jgi:hypothetical protein
MYVLFTKHYLCNHIHNNETGGVCRTYGQEEKCIQIFGGKSGVKTNKHTFAIDPDVTVVYTYRKQ